MQSEKPQALASSKRTIRLPVPLEPVQAPVVRVLHAVAAAFAVLLIIHTARPGEAPLVLHVSPRARVVVLLVPPVPGRQREVGFEGLVLHGEALELHVAQ